MKMRKCEHCNYSEPISTTEGVIAVSLGPLSYSGDYNGRTISLDFCTNQCRDQWILSHLPLGNSI